MIYGFIVHEHREESLHWMGVYSVEGQTNEYHKKCFDIHGVNDINYSVRKGKIN